MRKLEFLYEMQLQFDGDVTWHSFCLRCLPKMTCFQHIAKLTVEISPYTSITNVVDAFGNKMCSGYIEDPHSFFSFKIAGTALTNSENIDMSIVNPLFRYPTPQTTLTSGYERFLEVASHKHDPIQKVLAMSDMLYKSFVYKSNTTNTTTTAQQALNQGCGVCQDYSHILISLCRMLKIPARYIAGFMFGEGATHAWVEFYARGHWIGIDPTNDCMVDDKYVKLSEGRDASDCIVDKGVFYGNVRQVQTVNVSVKEIPL